MVAPKEMLPGDPDVAWDVFRLFPRQGNWSVDEYLVVNRLTNHYIELHEGRVEALEMPTKRHQEITFQLTSTFKDYFKRTGAGKAVMAPYPVMVNETTYREPDVVAVLAEHIDWFREDFATGADVVVEVLSQDRKRDLVDKRAEYAAAGFREYWLVDARDDRVTLLVLRDGAYVVHAEAVGTGQIESVLLPGLVVDVGAVLAAR